MTILVFTVIMKTKSMNLTVKTMGKEKNVFVGNRDKEDNRLSNRSNINGSIKDKCQSLAYPADNK